MFKMFKCLKWLKCLKWFLILNLAWFMFVENAKWNIFWPDQIYYELLILTLLLSQGFFSFLNKILLEYNW